VKTWMSIMAVLLCMGCSCDGKKSAKKESAKADTTKAEAKEEKTKPAGNAAPAAKKEKPKSGGDIRDEVIPGYKENPKSR
jgi:hypothetical protein